MRYLTYGLIDESTDSPNVGWQSCAVLLFFIELCYISCKLCKLFCTFMPPLWNILVTYIANLVCFLLKKNLYHKQGPVMLTYSVSARASVCSLLCKSHCWILIWSLAKRGMALRATDLVKSHLHLGKIYEPYRFSRNCSSAIHLWTWQPTIHFAWLLSVSFLCVTFLSFWCKVL